MIKSLQSLRFFAIFLVFLAHMSFFKDTQYANVYDVFFNDGGVAGVGFFFLLSGFVIMYSYYNKIDNYSFNTTKKFFIKRVKKFYPLHIVTFIVSIPLFIGLLQTNLMNEIVKMTLNVALLQSFIPLNSVNFSYNGVAWFLSTSLLFYILTPFIIVQFKKLDYKYLLPMLIFFYFIQLIFVFINIDNPNASWIVYVNPFYRIFDFMIGGILGIMYLKNKEKVKYNEKVFSTLEIISITLFVIAYLNARNIDIIFRYSVYYTPFFIFILYVFSIEKGFLSKKVFSKDQFVYLGTISFEFFMIHQLVTRYLDVVISNKYSIVKGILNIVISLVLSHFIYNLTSKKKVLYKS